MGGRKQHKSGMIRRANHRDTDVGTHRDKYATKPREPEPVSVKTERTRPVAAVEDVHTVDLRPALTVERLNEAKAEHAARERDAESEEILRSLPGGTIDERLRSAKRGLFQSQDSIQSTLIPPRAD